jgi:signal peptidase I
VPERSAPSATTILRVIASLLGPGAGHALAGHPRAAAAWLVASAAVSPAAMAMTALAMSDARVPAGALFAIVALWLVWGAAAIHAAGAAPRQVEPPRWAAAVAVLVAGMTAQLAGGWFTRTWLLAAIPVGGVDMAPTLDAGDVAFVRVGLARPAAARGQVVAWRAPDAPDTVRFGRVVATEGSAVGMDGAALTVDGVPWTGEATGTFPVRSPDGAVRTVALRPERSWQILDDPDVAGTGGAVTVPPGHVFVVGDHRDVAVDSRAVGPLPVDAIVGVAVLEPE